MPVHSALALSFQEPPRDAVASHPTLILTLFAVVAVVVSAIGATYALRTRSALLWLACAVSGLTLFPLLVEPVGDYILQVWYPTNHAIAATVFDRPMPWVAVLFYVIFIPNLTLLAYATAKRSTPRRFLVILGVIGVVEVGGEALGNHLQWIVYYANPATVFGVPIYCLAQNGGFLAGIVWTLAWLLPRTHGWRWALVPVAIAAVLPIWAIIGTWPAYLALYLDASTPVIWFAAVVSTALNAALVVACVYSPQLKRLRETESQTDKRAAHPADNRHDLSGVA